MMTYLAIKNEKVLAKIVALWIVKFSALILTLFIGAASSFAQESSAKLGPAPNGYPVTVAAKVIHANFARKSCPKVVKAYRWTDGSIRANCSNGEAFMIFSLGNRSIAMSCSAASALGVSGCS